MTVKWNGGRLRAIRTGMGATQHRVALLVPCADQEMWHWEHGRCPTGATLVNLLDALNRIARESNKPEVTLGQLMGE